MAEGIKYEKIPRFEGSIHLYDGAPEIDPSDNKMVCFTTPNYSWLDGMIKAENHIPLYLPVWTLDELWDANEALELGLDYRTVEERFLFFGGSARYCLTLDADYYRAGVEELTRRARSIQTFLDI